jgi:PAS domain S-box-containing protein
MDDSVITILHVDDNETNRYVVSRMLKQAGFLVKEAATGEAGLRMVAQQPDLIILDVKLPDIDGFEVCRRIKENPVTSFIPVLHLSASFVKSQDKAQGLEGGADAYLAQPVEPIELIATVKALLRIREAEESALGLAKEWQTTFDAMSDSVCLLDAEGKVIRCNSAMCQLLEKPFSDIEGSFHQELLQKILDLSEVCPFSSIQETQRRESRELKNGKRWFAITAEPIFDQSKAFTGAVYIVADISDRKCAEEAQQESEERFRLLLDNVKEYAIFFLDTEARVVRWSAGAESILGYQEAEILGQHSSIIFTLEDLERGEDKKELHSAATEGRAEDERWHVRKDGSRFWASGFVTP